MNNEIKTWEERHRDWETETVRDAMQSEIDDLRAKVESLAADAERINFMQANPHMYFNVNKAGTRWRFGHFSNYPQECYPTLREALDAEKEKA